MNSCSQSFGQVWLITGASSGFGAALTQVVLERGHTVIATARNVDRAREQYPRTEELGGTWMTLDVTSPTTTEQVAEIIRRAGKIDVLVNNAGYALLGSIEDMSEQEIYDQINTNFCGPIRTIKAVLPFFRAQGHGVIVNMSSMEGLKARPCAGLYAATKQALEGLSESLSSVFDSFNIRMLIVEPGSFRTNLLHSHHKPQGGTSSHYANTSLDRELTLVEQMADKQPGDPMQAAKVIVDVVLGQGCGEGKTHYLRLPLGKDCLERGRAKVQQLTETFDALEEIAVTSMAIV